MKETTAPELRIENYKARGASPELAAAMDKFTQFMLTAGVEFMYTTIWRSNDEQTRLYNQGRTTPGAIVTNARAGTSAHNRTFDGWGASDAFDACPLIEGKPSWSTTGKALKAWRTMEQAALHAGIKWGHNMKGIEYDWSHFQYIRGQ